MFTTSCSLLRGKIEYIPKPVFIHPPDILLKDCHISKLEGNTTEDLVNLANNRGIDLKVCNEDKRSLRKWKEDNQHKNK